MKNLKDSSGRGITVITLRECILIYVISVIVAFAFGLYLAGCGPMPGPPIEPEGGTKEDCPSACANLQDLRCPGWRGSPGPDGVFDTEDDVSCIDVCIYMMTVDETMTLFPICTAQAADCDEVEECFEGGY